MAPSEPHKDSAVLWKRVLSVPVPAGEVDQHRPPTGSAGAVSTEESHIAEGLPDARSLGTSCLPLQEPRPEVGRRSPG